MPSWLASGRGLGNGGGMTVPSPCNQVCVIDPESGYCRGCRRTIDEIAAWAAADDRWKQSVLDMLKQRTVTTS
ncbi:hypothetical protein ASE00_03735 [Sphingomonas sp. Root710]|nr:hypothetical protein ASE00_03735 [Sphingomonas sp. Root710]